MSPTVAPSVALLQADLDCVLDLYERGLCLQAYEAARVLAPLRQWTGTAARVLAGRLAGNLGAPRLAAWHFARAWRNQPDHPEACWYHAYQILDRRGPLAAWDFMKRRGEMADAPLESRSHWLSLHACVLGRLRDFDAAELWLARAELLDADRPWLFIERGALLALEDRYDDAVAAAQQSLVVRPWYRPGVQQVAYLLVQMERDLEALDLLTQASQHLENGPVFAQLALLQTELGRHSDARRSYERYAELSPLLEKTLGEWLNGRRSDCAYFCGDVPQAIAFAKQVPGPFFEQVAARLASPPEGARRTVLPVGFVHQHQYTCVPATLAAISRFWDMPAEHLEVAAAICYDGTPHHSERHWAETHDWIAREFTITWDSTVALLDRGVPFTLTTPETASSHLQAVIGYDGLRGTLLIRDPGERHQREFLADALFQRYASSGPRGMALVPAAKAELLTTLDLPDCGLYDHMNQLQRALQVHNRTQAEETAAAMTALAPDHRLTIQAQRSLAAYDADPAGMLAATERLLAQFPEDLPLQLTKVSCLHDLARRDERLALLRALCAAPTSDPVCWQQYAGELAVDAREHSTALRLLRRSLRLNPYNAGTYATLATIFWARRRFADALMVNRFAACLGDRNEGLAQAYFAAARAINKTEEPLRFLHSRFERFGKKSSQPARTLAWALAQLARTPEAFAVLDEALTLRPEDGDLLSHAAEVHTNHGNFDRAAVLLAAAEGHTQRTGWRRVAANVASARGDRSAALNLWQDVLAAEPLAQDAHQSVALLLAETRSRAAALEHLEQACAAFPHHYALHKLWIDWLQQDGSAIVEPIVRKLIAIHPADAWARRELALKLADLGRLDEAFAELELAHGLEPAHPSYWSVRAHVCVLAGKAEEAKAANREAIRLSVDHDFPVRELVAGCDTLAERREALAFVEQELIRQVTLGDGLLTYRDLAQHTLPPEELLQSLQAALAARPDLWHAWSAVIRQRIDMNHLDDALVLARQAVARFPLLPAMWLDLATVYARGKDADSAIEALQRAHQINPNWDPPLRQLADTYERQGRLDEAQELLERAVARAPLLAVNHAALAQLLWRRGEQEAAVERARQALLLDPGTEWAWNMLNDWAARLQRPELAVDFARDLVRRRPDEARSWLMLARALTAPAVREECLAALDRVLALNPRCLEAHDQRAALLAQARRFEEARAACRPAPWAQPPLLLRGRAAWIDAEEGNAAGAIKAMRDVLIEDPNYYWGWMQLANWYHATSAWNEYLHAACELARLAPGDAMALAYRGDARLRTGDRPGGKADLRQALELTPDYEYAGTRLVDELLTDEELDEAAQVLTVVATHCEEQCLLPRRIRLEALQGEREKALGLFRQLCVHPGANPSLLEEAQAALAQAGWKQATHAALREAMVAPQAHPHVGDLWVRLTASPAPRDLHQVARCGQAGRHALVAHLVGLGRTKRCFALRRWIRRYRDLLGQDTWGWGMVGFALSLADDDRALVSWMSDWTTRLDAEPWMLSNLMLGLRGLGRSDEAQRVCEHALKALAPDYTWAYHEIWLALDGALDGDASAAAARLARIAPHTLDAYHRMIRALAEAVLRVREAEVAGRAGVFAEVRRQLATMAATSEPIQRDRALYRTYRRSVHAIGARCGGVKATVWSWWRHLRPLLPARKADG